MTAPKLPSKIYQTIFLILLSLIFVAKPETKALETDLGTSIGGGIASTFNIDDTDVVDGDIVCFVQPSGELKRCRNPYDEKMFGVVATTTQLVLRSDETGRPVVREGKVIVNVTDVAGEIEAGDYITTSEIIGKGQKATELTGFVLGRALNPLKKEANQTVDLEGKKVFLGQIELALSVGPLTTAARSSVFKQLGISLLRTVQKPEGTTLFLRYLIAGMVMVVVTLFAFNNFGHNITKGVESVGRNPLAKNQIQFMVIVNVILIAVVTLGGMILGLAIIRL